MTRSRRPAAATRVMLAGVGTAAALGVVAGLGTGAAQPAAVPGGEPLRVVITDARIDPDAAVAAATRGALTGQTTVHVPVADAPEPAPVGGSDATHTSTRSS